MLVLLARVAPNRAMPAVSNLPFRGTLSPSILSALVKLPVLSTTAFCNMPRVSLAGMVALPGVASPLKAPVMASVNGLVMTCAVRLRLGCMTKLNTGSSAAAALMLIPVQPLKTLPGAGVAVMITVLPTCRDELGTKPALTVPLPSTATWSVRSSVKLRVTMAEMLPSTSTLSTFTVLSPVKGVIVKVKFVVVRPGALRMASL